MKKQNFIFMLLISLVIALYPATASAQQSGIINWLNNGDFNAFLYCDVDSITYSKVDLDGHMHSNFVVQEVWTADSLYRIPMNMIDSVAFKAPETIMKNHIFHITEWHYPYVTESSEMTVTFDASIPEDSLPTVGQVVVSDMAFVQYFEKGFAGRVVQIDNMGSNVRIVCEEISFEDIYEQLFSFGKSVGYSSNGSPSEAPQRITIDEDGVTTFNLSDYWPFEPIKIIEDESGHVHLNVEPSISLDYALCYNVKGKENRFKCVLSNNLSCKFDINWNKNVTKHFEPQKPFAKIKIPTKIPLLFAQFTVNGFLDLNGRIDLSAELPFMLQSNIGYDSQNGFVKTFGSEVDPPRGSVDLNAEVYTGLSLGFESFFINERLDWAEASVQLKAGPKFIGNIKFQNGANYGLDWYNNFKDSQITIKPLVADLSASVNTIFFEKEKTWSSEQWSVFTDKVYYLFPEFTKPYTVGENHYGCPAALTTDVSRDLIFEVTPGIALYQNGTLVDSKYSTEEYQNSDWNNSNLLMDLLDKAPGTYTAKPIFTIFNTTNAIVLSDTSYTSTVTIPVPPAITATPNSIIFGNVTQGDTKTETLTIVGSNLTKDITLTSTNGVFSLGEGKVGTITLPSEGGSVKVTYEPVSIGTDSGDIIISINGTEQMRVSLIGNCLAPPSITISPEYWDFGTVGKGLRKTQKFKVTGTNLTGTLTVLPAEDIGGMFTVSPTTLKGSEGTVTVTYTPTQAGNHSGFFTVQSINPTVSARASYEGKCTEITTSEPSLDFGTIAKNTSKELTFTITGVNLSGDLTIKETGSSYFSVTPTSIRKDSSNGANGTVTVTYNPREGGNHSGRIIISDGVITKYVTVTGKSAEITITPTYWNFGAVGKGLTASHQFTVTGTNTTGTLTVTSGEDIGGMFTVSPAVLGSGGGTVTVTYKPTQAGNHSGFFSVQSYDPTISASASYDGKCTEITTSKSTLDFGAIANGDSKELTFTVTGVNLSGNLTLSCSGSYYTVKPTSISKNSSNGASGTVTVTYNPKVVGNHNGTITISDGTIAKTVSLLGKSAGITITPTYWNFGTVGKGLTASHQFTVTGTNTTGTLTVTSGEDIGGMFTVSPAVLGSGGGTVTVTYKPTQAGNHSGFFTVQSINPTVSARASYDGKCTILTPVLNVEPTSLTFSNVNVGSSVTSTFRVKGTNLNGDVHLVLMGTNAKMYSISTTSISASQAANGYNVTVTYTPTQKTIGSSQHIATVVISSDGATNKEVSLTGTATQGGISPY